MMIDKLLWNNIFLPNSVKKAIVLKYSGFSLSSTMPVVFSLLRDENAIVKLSKLFSWGLNPTIQTAQGHNLIHHLFYLYREHTVSLSRANEILDCLLKNKVKLLVGNTTISNYEKDLNIISLKQDKEFKEYIDVPEQSNQKVNIIQHILDCVDSELIVKILKSVHLEQSEKSLLDYVYLKKMVQEIQVFQYFQATSEIEKIIYRGNIFKTQNHVFNSLKQLFLIGNLEDIISKRMILRCYEQFSRLNVIAKKTLTSKLIMLHKENAIFNLLSYGLNLNWSIRNNEGQENIVALEVLNSIPMIKMILSSEKFNICSTNTHGENILHLLGSSPLNDQSIKEQLSHRINKLSDMQKSYLFNQINKDGLTPLFKSIYQQDEIMIEYLLDWDLNIEEEIEGFPKNYNSALTFLDKTLLPIARKEIIRNKAGLTSDDRAYAFWEKLSKLWNSNKLFAHLESFVAVKAESKKVIKI